MSTEKRYSLMTKHELEQEIANVKEKARKAEQLGYVNEFAVLERKAIMASCYLLNPKDYRPGTVYAISNDPGSYFKIDYLNGVFAWGYRLKGEKKLEALPIAMLDNRSEGGEQQ
ncbi:YfhH family protein [Jeotgalibacillus sp. ET6]|uniref:YfhH family protein n=1 Tax=Jeotgalibacillus sp. ET6 TaxID=3037260 RepID=UPI00241862A1|nr:YfhH family protein [Jeotgalibacillus sp. ET6]MDG5473334.1 YfhH family protein [Jeotgalibacillus sp. ET6]